MKPITRLEHFLAKIAGDKDAKNLNPITRKEYYLNEIAKTSQPFVVTFSGTDEGEDAACDKTYDEIKAAYEAGQELRVVYNDQEVSAPAYPLQLTIVKSETLIFSNLVVSSVTALLSGGWIGIYCSINKSGAVHCFLDDET